eukprot:5611350-Prymnesium_polylepis.1
MLGGDRGGRERARGAGRAGRRRGRDGLVLLRLPQAVRRRVPLAQRRGAPGGRPRRQLGAGRRARRERRGHLEGGHPARRAHQGGSRDRPAASCDAGRRGRRAQGTLTTMRMIVCANSDAGAERTVRLFAICNVPARCSLGRGSRLQPKVGSPAPPSMAQARSRRSRP